MVARNHRVVISVRGRFEIFNQRGCNETNINASRRHLLLVCCHGAHRQVLYSNPKDSIVNYDGIISFGVVNLRSNLQAIRCIAEGRCL